MTDLVQLNREYWSQREFDNSLYDGEKYCIQGFYGRNLRLSKEQMLNKRSLSECYEKLPKELEWLFEPVQWGRISFTTHQNFLAYVNDNKNISVREKIRTFTQVFKAQGIELEVM